MTTPKFASFRVITTAKALLLAACLSLPSLVHAHAVDVIVDTTKPASIGAAYQAVQNAVITKAITTQQATVLLGAISSAIVKSASGGGSTRILGNNSAPANRFALPGQGESGGTGLAAQSPGDKPWNGWLSWTGGSIGYDFAPLKSSGRINAYGVGVDYSTQWSGMRTVLGVGLLVDKSKVNTEFNGGTIDGSGSMVTPYLGLSLNRNWDLSAALGFGSGKSKTNALGVSGEQKSDRYLANVGLSYNTMLGTQWMLSGNGGLTATRNEDGAYTLSNGTFLDSGVTTNRQASLGGRITYNGGTFFPYAGLTYNYDLKAPTKITANNQVSAGDRDGFMGVLGVQIPTGRGVSMGIQYSTEQGRSQVKNNSFTVNLGLNW